MNKQMLNFSIVSSIFLTNFVSINYKNNLEKPIFNRSVETFILSKIFKYENLENIWSENDELKQYMKYYLLTEIGTNSFEWKNDRYFNYYKKQLEVLEKFYYQVPSLENNQKFNNYFKKNNFKDIQEIENKIKIALNYDFSFKDIINPNKYTLRINEQIVLFYNFIINAKILDIDTLLQSVYQFKLDKYLDFQTMATSSAMKYNNFCLTIIDFTPYWYNEPLLMKNFVSGWNASGHYFVNFVHEFAHNLFKIYSLSPIEKNNLNQNVLKADKNSTTEKIMEYNFINKFGLNVKPEIIKENEVIDVTLNLIYEKLNIENKNNDILLKLAKWTAVPSMYGRTALIDRYLKPHPDTEWLAEAFVYFYFTPLNSRTKIWEFWHDIFTISLPRIFN